MGPVPDSIPSISKGENQVFTSAGVDLGLKSAVTLSTGEKIEAPKPLRLALRKLARLQRAHSRNPEGSSNHKKSAVRLARLHWRVAQVRMDWQRKVTAGLAKRFDVVFMEDLNIKGMVKNHSLALSISDIGWGEIGRQLGYKGSFRPARSARSDASGHVLPSLSLKTREWACPDCNVTHDRDVNAARNVHIEGLRLFDLDKYKISNTASCAEINYEG